MWHQAWHPAKYLTSGFCKENLRLEKNLCQTLEDIMFMLVDFSSGSSQFGSLSNVNVGHVLSTFFLEPYLVAFIFVDT